MEEKQSSCQSPWPSIPRSPEIEQSPAAQKNGKDRIAAQAAVTPTGAGKLNGK
jgi:hypothetical protein